MTFKKLINNFMFLTVVMTTFVSPVSAEDVKLSAEYLSSHELASDLNTTSDAHKAIGSVKVITMGMRKGVAKQNVKLREKADAGSKDLRYCRNSEDGPCTNYIPKGDEVIIIARTRDKFKVQKWEGYWYYVEFAENIDVGWVFSEFIDLK